MLNQGGAVWDAVAFGLGDCPPQINSAADVVYNLEMNRWGGSECLRLNILDMTIQDKG